MNQELSEKVKAALELAEMATPREWEVHAFETCGSGFIAPLVPGKLSVAVKQDNKDDAYFIAASHDHVDLIRDLHAALIASEEARGKAEGLVKASVVLRDDLLMRAEIGQRAAEKIVACGASAWIGFNKAIDAAMKVTP